MPPDNLYTISITKPMTHICCKFNPMLAMHHHWLKTKALYVYNCYVGSTTGFCGWGNNNLLLVQTLVGLSWLCQHRSNDGSIKEGTLYFITEYSSWCLLHFRIWNLEQLFQFWNFWMNFVERGFYIFFLIINPQYHVKGLEDHYVENHISISPIIPY